MSIPKPHITRELCHDGVTRYFFSSDRGFCIYGGYDSFAKAVRDAVGAHDAEVRRNNELEGRSFLFGKDAIFVINL